MTDSSSTPTGSAPDPSPSNLQAEGVAEPTPGGPLRQDGTDAGRRSGGHDDDASASRTNDKHASESGGGTIAIEDEQGHPDAEHDESPSPEEPQQENAESSLDQPSEG